MRKLGKFFMFAIVVVLLAACSNEEKSNKSTEAGDKGKIDLTYWFAYGGVVEEANKKMVEDFNNSQDKIHVTAAFQGSYFDLNSKVQASIAAGNPPDLFVTQDTMVETFAKDGIIENVTDLASEDEDVNLDDFIPGLLGNSYVDDQLYGLPFLKSTPLLYVNKTMLDEAGIELSQLETWEGFTEAAKKLTTDDVTGVSMELDVWLYESLIAQAGGSMLNEDGTAVTFNEAPGVEAIDFFRDLINEGVWKVPVGDTASQTSFQDFATQKSALRFATTAYLTTTLAAAEESGFELAAVMLPKNVEQAVTTGGSNITMIAGLEDEKKKAAWEFMDFIAQKEQNLYASEITGYLPIRYSSIESETVQKLHEEQPLFKVAADQLEYAEARPMTPGYNEITNIWVEEVERLISDPSLSTKEGLDSAAERSNKILN